MATDDQNDPVPISQADIVQVEIVVPGKLLFTFSDGSAASLDSGKVKRLVLAEADEIIPPTP